MEEKHMLSAFAAGRIRKSYVLGAAAALAMAALSSAVAQEPAHQAHHPEGTAQDAAPAHDMPEGGAMGCMMHGGGMMHGGMMHGGMMHGGGMMGMGMMENCPMMDASAHADGRIAFIKAELAITDQQKEAWEAYAAALKKNLDSMKGMREGMKKAMQAKSPVEHLDAHIAAMESRAAALKELRPALAALYETLSGEQKKKADLLLTGMGCMK